MRAGTRWGPVRSTRWMVVITALLALLAWGDSRHRVILAVATGIGLVATVVVSNHEKRQRAYWRDVGRTD